MNLKFQPLYHELCMKPQISYERFREILHELQFIGDFTDDLLKAVEEQLEQQNWGCLHRLIFVIQTAPNKKFTRILCHLLDNYKAQDYSDSIVDALFDIEDEKSIPSLIEALNYHEAGDDDYNFNKKVLYALERIGSTKAFEIIKNALTNENPVISETAKEILERRSAN